MPRQSPYPGSVEAYFEVSTSVPSENFVIRLTDAGKIQHARNIINGTETERVAVMGTIIKSPAPYNKPWSFHLDPNSIEFFQVATEVCDAAVSYVESHLKEVGGAFLPGNRWCPWSSRVSREVEKK
jgi:hypothetical protein